MAFMAFLSVWRFLFLRLPPGSDIGEPGIVLFLHRVDDRGMLSGQVLGLAGIGGDVIQFIARRALDAAFAAALQTAQLGVTALTTVRRWPGCVSWAFSH